MPTKPNRAGQEQPYVPEGHGDISGEYGEHGTGSNRNYTSPTDINKQLPYKVESALKHNGIDIDGMNNKEKESKYKEIGGDNNWANKAYENENITQEMKSISYTNNFVEVGELENYFGAKMIYKPEVKITRGSLTADEIGNFNNQLKEMFDKYPKMQKFNTITVKNATASSNGGYIQTKYDTNYKNKIYGLYINAGWLEKTPSERTLENNLKYYTTKIEYIKSHTEQYTEPDKIIKNFNEALQSINEKIKKRRNNTFNIVEKLDSRKDRLKALVGHELMHRIYQNNVKTPELTNKIKEIYRKALQNGDAQKISTYATTNTGEFISEANSQIICGIETPEYIVDIVNEIKGVK